MYRFFKKFSSILSAMALILMLQFALSPSALAKGGRSGDDSIGSTANKVENFQSNSHDAHIDAPGASDTIKNDVTGAAQMDGAMPNAFVPDSTNGARQNDDNNSNLDQ